MYTDFILTFTPYSSQNMAKKKSTRKTPARRKAKKPQAAYFLSLSLRNVRCFGDETQTLDLSDGDGKPAQWTILLGENGTGKTTILQALAGFAPNPNSRLQDLEIPRVLEIGLLEFGNIASFLRFPAASISVMKIHSDYVTLPSLSANWQQDEKQVAAMSLTPREQWELHGDAPNGPGVSFSPLENRLFFRCGYGAGRRMGTTNLSDSENDDAYASLFSDIANLRNAEEWLLQLDYSANKQSEIQERSAERLEQVISVLINILPDVNDIRITEPTSDDWTPNVEFLSHEAWVPLKGISYGYRTLIAWMVDFASRMFERYPDSKDPLAEPAVVLVDEIDLHLHPTWQRKLMDYLSERFPNTQFIATAHSPLIVQAAQDANIAVCRWEGDHVVIDNDVRAIQGWRIDQVLTSDLFGLESARPPQLEKQLAERKELLTKARLTKRDKTRLGELETEIGPLPIGETAEQSQTISLLEETLDVLKKHGDKRS